MEQQSLDDSTLPHGLLNIWSPLLRPTTERGKVSFHNMTAYWEYSWLVPALMDDSEGFKITVEEVTAHGVEMGGKLELRVEPKDVTESLQSHKNTWMDEELLLLDEQSIFWR